MADTRDPQARQERAAGGLQRTAAATPDRLRRRDPFDESGFGPFSLMRRMQEDMDRLLGSVWGGRSWPGSFGQSGEWAPAIEAFQRGNELVVRAEVPGLTRDDLSVEIGEDALTIQGERKYDHHEEREGIYKSERAYGTFSRVIPLPEGAVSESATATFKDGVLEIIVQAPSQEVRRGRRIEIGERAADEAPER